jgi:mRNA-degrading endonuclease toxin of MazEF toxin-antitoxin module
MTPSGTMPNQRDVFLAPFPFSDEETEKQRPVLIISSSVNNASGADVIVMAITSNLGANSTGIRIDAGSCETGTLPAPSLILPLKVYSVAQERIGRFYCRVANAPFNQAIEALLQGLGLH